MFVLAIMLCVPGIRLCVFSTGKRASGSLMEIVLTFLLKIPGAKNRIVKQNQENLYIAEHELGEGIGQHSGMAQSLHSDGSTSKLFSFPSSVAGNKTKTKQKTRGWYHKHKTLQSIIFCCLCDTFYPVSFFLIEW